MSGAIRGASRSGRYAKRSIATPRKPEPTIATTNMKSISSATGIAGLSGPPSSVSTPKPMNAPIM